MNRARGIDVSHHKPIKDYRALFDSGVSFVGVKTTEGNTFTDPMLLTHSHELRKEVDDLKLVIYYHFARSGDPKQQALRFMDKVGPLKSNERLSLDLEVLPAFKPNTEPDNDSVLEWMTKFYSEIFEIHGDRRPFIYTSRRIWRMFGDPEWSMGGDIDLWAPRYNTTNEPALPAPWKKTGWTIWQWTDGGDTGPEHSTPGVGRCDANYFRGDETSLDEYMKLVEQRTFEQKVRSLFASISAEQEEKLRDTLTSTQYAEYENIRSKI